MIHTKRVIFMILPLLFVPLVYGISSTPDACALPPDPNWGSGEYCEADDADPVPTTMLCCWEEPDLYYPGKTIVWCQRCDITATGQPTDCGPVWLRPQPTGPFTPPEGGVLQQPPPASPLGPRPFTPQGEATVQQPPQTTPTPSPEDDQSDDGPGPFRGPLGGGVLQEPEDEENNNEPEDDGNEEQVP